MASTDEDLQGESPPFHRLCETVTTPNTLLLDLCKSSRLTPADLIKVLHDDANVNMENVRGETPLHLLCTHPISAHVVDAVKLLLEEGADVNKLSFDCSTPLNCACSNSVNPLVIRELLVAGADPDYMLGPSSNVYRTVSRSNCEGLLYLTEMGASVKPKKHHCLVALNHAAAYASIDCVTILLGSGADVDQRDCTNLTPMMQLLYAINLDSVEEVNTLHRVISKLLSVGPSIPKSDVRRIKRIQRRSLNPERYTCLLKNLDEYHSNPLTLKDACRKQIRKSIFSVERFQSPIDTVGQLGLPKPLCAVLLCGYVEMIETYKIIRYH